MIYMTPALEQIDHDVLRLIDNQRERLHLFVEHLPRRWDGALRRSTLAKAIKGSNSIEGYDASLDEAIAVVADEPQLDERTEASMALRGYRNALTYIMQACTDPYFDFSKQFLKSLHFMMLGHDMTKLPGRWRPGNMFVVNEQNGQKVYEAPSGDAVNDLVNELIVYLRADTGENALVKGAMAHLNLTMIHPFKDGNGRMARALQTFVLAKEGMFSPVFSSIEEWLGKHTEEYYDALEKTGLGKWSPKRSALHWVRFCLKAHYQQAETLIRRNEEYGLIFEKISKIIEREKLSDRSAIPLFEATLGLRVTNIRYRSDADVNEATASRDLKRISELGLLQPIGEKRARFYKSGKELIDLRLSVRQERPEPTDPYARARQSYNKAVVVEPEFPGLDVKKKR